MRHSVRIAVGLFGVLTLAAGCKKPTAPAIPGMEPVSERDRQGRVVIVHTNDQHASIRPSAVPGSEGPAVGGALALSAWVEAMEDVWGEERVLVLDAGDLLSGSPVDEYVVGGVRGGAMLNLLEVVGYDAWTVGNHEFDKGLEDAGAFVAASPIPVLGANLDAVDGRPAFPNLGATEILDVAGVRVAVIGVTTPGLTRYVNEDLAGLVVSDPVVAVRAELGQLPDDVDVVVALSHLGLEDDQALAEEVPELDLIVGGHSHSRLEEPEQVGDTWIVQAGCCGRSFGVSVLTPGHGEAVDLDYELVEPDPNALPTRPSPEAREFMAQWEATLNKDWGVVLGENLFGPLTRKGNAESGLGRWVCETLRKAAGADVGLYNRSGLRANIPMGLVSRETLYNVFPFGNEMVIATVSGRDLLALAVRNATAVADPESARVMEQEGLAYTWRRHLGAAELVALTVNGEPVELDTTYAVATNSFVARQWGRYVGGAPMEVRSTGRKVRDVVQERVKAEGIISVPPVGATPH
jgi:2',3'-cyclic-nucleotide 2'-phosphodiesterase (5'-nucleotidase family)